MTRAAGPEQGEFASLSESGEAVQAASLLVRILDRVEDRLLAAERQAVGTQPGLRPAPRGQATAVPSIAAGCPHRAPTGVRRPDPGRLATWVLRAAAPAVSDPLAVQALRELDRSGQPVMFASVAAAAGSPGPGCIPSPTSATRSSCSAPPSQPCARLPPFQPVGA